MGEHDGHRDRMKKKFLEGKREDLTDAQVLEIFLYYLIRRKDLCPLAERLINQSGGIAALMAMPEEKLRTIKGVGKKTAYLLGLVRETLNRSEEQHARACTLQNPVEVFRYISARLKYLKEESVFIICLDEKLRPLHCDIAGEQPPLINLIAQRAAMTGTTTVILAGNSLMEFPALSAASLEAISSLNKKLAGIGIVLLDCVRIRDEMYSSAAELGALADGAPIRHHYRPNRTAPLRKPRYKVERLI